MVLPPTSDRWTCLNQGHDGDHGLLAEGPVGEEPGPTCLVPEMPAGDVAQLDTRSTWGVTR